MESIKLLAQTMVESKNMLVLTGAGMSTESGIPDFRSKGTGIWEKLDPANLSYYTLFHNSKFFYQQFELFAKMGEGTQPNKGHYILAELEEMGIVKQILTQNVDGFHMQAGSKKVIEAHGHFRECKCQKCGKVYDYSVIDNQLKAGTYYPRSECCNSLMRPCVVLFGDQLPQEYHRYVNNDLYKVDFMLVIGTSLQVMPVCELIKDVPAYAIINRDKTKADYKAKVAIHKPIGETLELVLNEIKSMKGE